MLLPIALLLLAQDVVIRSDTRLVEISVSATDKQGRAVAGLARDDFEVFDNRAPRRIAVFSTQADRLPPAPPAAPGAFSNRFPPAGEGYAVVLLDWLNTEWSDQTRARHQVIEMLGRIQAADRVALYVLDRRVRILHELGGDPALLVKKLAGLRGDASARSDQAPSPFEAAFSSTMISPMTPQERIFRLDRRILDTFAALEAIGDHLAGVPGKKSLIWVSAGFPSSIDQTQVRGARPGERTYTEQFNRLLRKFNNHGICIYPVDARGLTPSPGAFANIATMQQLAARTGGRAWYNRNDLDLGMRLALDELRTTYTLAYYAPEAGARTGFHQLRVRVRRPGLTLRHREGYWVEPPAKEDVQSDLQRALLAPVDSSALALSGRAVRQGEVIRIQLQLDPTHPGSVRLLARFAAADGTQVGRIASETVEPGPAGLIRRSAPIPAGASTLRVVVRHEPSGTIGTLSIPLRAVPRN